MSLNIGNQRVSRARLRAPADAEPDPAFALFRRAVADNDAASWRALKRRYQRQVLGWVRSTGAPAGERAKLAALAWEKFATHFTAAKLEAVADSADACRYLKLCVRCAAIDRARAGHGVALADRSPAPGGD